MEVETASDLITTDEIIVEEIVEHLISEVMYEECVSDILRNTDESLDEITFDDDNYEEDHNLNKKLENPDAIECFTLETTPDPTTLLQRNDHLKEAKKSIKAQLQGNKEVFDNVLFYSDLSEKKNRVMAKVNLTFIYKDNNKF